MSKVQRFARRQQRSVKRLLRVLQKRRTRKYILAGVVGAFVGFGLFSALAKDPSNPQLFVTPERGKAGSVVTVQVRSDSGTREVNVVEAKLHYSVDKLEFVKADSSGTAFEVEATPVANDNGTLTIVRGTTRPVAGDALVTSITFRVLSADGVANITFDPESSLLLASNGKNIVKRTGKAAFEVSGIASASVPAMLMFNPSTKTVAMNEEVSVQVWANGGSEATSVVQAEIEYAADKFEFVSFDSAGSDFEVEAVMKQNAGRITMARGTTSPAAGSKLVGSFKLRAKDSTGIAHLTFLQESIVGRAGSNESILGSTAPAEIKIVDPAE